MIMYLKFFFVIYSFKRGNMLFFLIFERFLIILKILIFFKVRKSLLSNIFLLIIIVSKSICIDYGSVSEIVIEGEIDR